MFGQPTQSISTVLVTSTITIINITYMTGIITIV
jgi:hypothetical protein